MTEKEQTEDINAKIDEILRGSGLDEADFPVENEETSESPAEEEANEPPTEVETNEDITPADDGGHDEVEISEEEVKPKKSSKKPAKTVKKPSKPKDKKPKEEKPLTEKEKAWKARHAAWVEFDKAKKLMPEWIAYKKLKDEYIAKYGNE